SARSRSTCTTSVLPRLENACIQASQPATAARVGLWLRAAIRVPARPDWFFVKLHAHGATKTHREALLGPAMVEFHEALARLAAEGPRFFAHCVAAREMYTLVKAAEAGWAGPVAEARDFEYVWGGGAVEPAVARAGAGGGRS